MSIPFHCPHCQLFTLVDDEFAGLSGPCASCGKFVAVPMLAANATTPVGESTARIRRDSSLAKVLLIVAACMAASVLVLVVGGLLLMPALKIAQQARYKRNCSEKLRQIGLALAHYHDRCGSYPPAVVYDSVGKPMHSWRVLILPDMGEQALFDEYQFDVAWDDPRNLMLLRKMPDVFHCEGDELAKVAGETTFFVVVGPRTAFPKNGATRRTDMTDDPSSTIVLVEAQGRTTAWTEPKDIQFSELRINFDGLGGIGGLHDQGVNVLCADQLVRFISDVATDETLQSMSTISGSEIIPWEDLE